MALSDFNIGGPFILPGVGLFGIPSGGLVRYVYQDASGNGIASLDQVPASMQDASDLTVAAALGKCRANRGDVIVPLPGHVETIGAAAWTPVAGVSVLCVGNGDKRPTFNWTAAGSQIVFAAADFRISNAVLNLAATATVSTTKAIQVSAARNVFSDCKIVAGAAGGSQVATLAIELVTGADRFKFWGNEVYAPADAAVGDLVKLTNAVDWCEFIGNDIDVGMTATTSSLITFTTAPTNIRIGSRKGPYQGNFLRNSKASSTVCITGVANSTGWIDNNMCAIEAATPLTGIIGTAGNMHLGLNYGSEPGKAGALLGTVSS